MQQRTDGSVYENCVGHPNSVLWRYVTQQAVHQAENAEKLDRFAWTGHALCKHYLGATCQSVRT